VFPIAELVHELARQGIDTLVDGAHAPGMLPLALDAIGAAYYTGNGHKWLCAPKGSAFLHVRRDRQAHVRPLAISHGANASQTGQSRFRLEFDIVATMDPTPLLAMASAIQYMGSLMPGGWPEVMAANRALARAGRDLLCEALGVEGPVAVEMLGSMAMVPLGDHGSPPFRLTGAQIHEALFRMHHIEVPIYEWPAETVRDAGSPPSQPFVRISAQRYNTIGQYAMLADTLVRILGD
jgi:isopenicillin-N epimerase